MKPIAKVLISVQSDKSGFDILRVYLEKDYEQALKDEAMLNKADKAGNKEYIMMDAEIFNAQNYDNNL